MVQTNPRLSITPTALNIRPLEAPGSGVNTRVKSAEELLNFRRHKITWCIYNVLNPFCRVSSTSIIDSEALVRLCARDLWWDPLYGLCGGALGALGLRGQILRCLRAVHPRVHQGYVDVIHVWQYKYFLKKEKRKKHDCERREGSWEDDSLLYSSSCCCCCFFNLELIL